MKFEFDTNNATELRAVEAAVAVLLGKQIYSGEANAPRDASPLVAAVTEAQEKLECGPPEIVETTNLTSDGPSYINASTGEETDSAGQPWNPELHSSSRAKVADGTWKKKRGAGKTEAPQPLVDAGEFPKIPDAPIPSAPPAAAPAPATPPVLPAPVVPTPPTPQADGLVAMNDIWALVTNGKTTINVVLAAAQRMGFADLGKVAQTATAEQRAALLKELTA